MTLSWSIILSELDNIVNAKQLQMFSNERQSEAGRFFIQSSGGELRNDKSPGVWFTWVFSIGSGGRIWTCDLRVMSQPLQPPVF